MITPYVVSIPKDQNVVQAIQEIQRYVKKQGQFQMFYTAYVVDDYQHLIGTVSVTELLMANKRMLIQNLMNPEVVAVDQDLDQEEVLLLAEQYDLVVVPVIDKHLRLIGRITIDDLVDVMEEEHHEDIGHFAGTGDEEVTETSVFRTSRDRLPWLLIGLIGGFISALVMSTYENSLIQMPEVTFFIPLVAALHWLYFPSSASRFNKQAGYCAVVYVVYGGDYLLSVSGRNRDRGSVDVLFQADRGVGLS